MKTELNTKSLILSGVAAFALLAGAAFAESSAVTDSSRAASDAGPVQDEEGAQSATDSEVTGGSNAPLKPGVVDDTRAATDMQGDDSAVETDTPPGTATGPRVEWGVVEDHMQDSTIDDLIGTRVLSSRGEDVGELDHVFLQDGRLAGVVGVGGFLGMGEHDVAIPLSQFGLTEQGDLMLDERTESGLRSMPEVDVDAIETINGDMRLGDS